MRKRPLYEIRYENWPIRNWRKSYRLLVRFTSLFACLGVIWNPYRSRFDIGYFDRLETQHLIWIVLRMFVKHTTHEKMKIIMAHYSKSFLVIAAYNEFSSRQSSWWITMKIQTKYLLQKNVYKWVKYFNIE